MAKRPVEGIDLSKKSLQTFLCGLGLEDNNNDLLRDETKPWIRMPYNVLVQMLYYLQDEDRRSVALVCHAWCTATRDPSLWMKKQFFLYSDHQIPRNMKWLQRHRKHLRHATVMCFGTFEKGKETFLERLWHSRLRSLELSGTAYWWASAMKQSDGCKIVTQIIALIKSQSKLISFQMGQALLSFQAGITILNVVAMSSGPTIKRLGLEDFFCEQHELRKTYASQTTQFVTCMTLFPHLSELTINFQYITVALLNWFSQNRRRQSVTLNVISWQNSFGPKRNYNLADAWKNLATSCAPARVCFTLQNIKDFVNVRTSVLVSTIPLSRLNLLGLMTAINERETMQLICLLKHVETSFKKSIVAIKLWGNNKSCCKIEDALIGLVTSCPLLVDLDLHMDLQPRFMERIGKLQQRQTIALQSFRLARSLNQTAEFDEFRRCIRHWYPLFKSLNLDFQIRAEGSPIHCAYSTYSFLVADNRGIIDNVDGRDNTGYWQCERNGCNDTDGSTESSSSNSSSRRSRNAINNKNAHDNNNNNNNHHHRCCWAIKDKLM